MDFGLSYLCNNNQQIIIDVINGKDFYNKINYNILYNNIDYIDKFKSNRKYLLEDIFPLKNIIIITPLIIIITPLIIIIISVIIIIHRL